jgi:hypothetical protein
MTSWSHINCTVSHVTVMDFTDGLLSSKGSKVRGACHYGATSRWELMSRDLKG